LLVIHTSLVTETVANNGKKEKHTQKTNKKSDKTINNTQKSVFTVQHWPFCLNALK